MPHQTSSASPAHTTTTQADSPGHKANILNTGFTHVGIGIVDGGPYGKMFTQLFVGR
ncbi:MAG TPA: CAP domain-containing protein [Symbiobacteriaceae bacterium]|nr:CAP domain-containing protein [Symbiobacteriaceae bacterium]